MFSLLANNAHPATMPGGDNNKARIDTAQPKKNALVLAGNESAIERKDFTRNPPPVGTIKRSVLDALRAGEQLTPKEAWLRYGTSRLAAVVHVLIAEGWPIDSELIPVEAANGRLARVARYSMRGAA